MKRIGTIRYNYYQHASNSAANLGNCERYMVKFSFPVLKTAKLHLSTFSPISTQRCKHAFHTPLLSSSFSTLTPPQTYDSSSPPLFTPIFTDPFTIRNANVLVLAKTTRYEHEQNSLGLKGERLHSELTRLGFISDRLIKSYERHMEGLSQVTRILKQNGMNVRVKHIDNTRHEDLYGVDLLVSCGGDGTLLKTASLLSPQTIDHSRPMPNVYTSCYSNVPADGEDGPNPFIKNETNPSSKITSNNKVLSSTIPVIGVNTDPQHSAGVLCSFSVVAPNTLERVLEHIHKGYYTWNHLSRIQITLVNSAGVERPAPYLALNDALVAESDVGRPSVYELSVNGQPGEIQRSSGVLIATGTGSTAWLSNAAGLDGDTVGRVLAEVGYPHNSVEAREIAGRINNRTIFPSNSTELEYHVREPIVNGLLSTRPYLMYKHGWCRKIAIRSLGWDARLSLDGIHTIPLEKGCSAVFEVGREEGSQLTILSLVNNEESSFPRK